MARVKQIRLANKLTQEQFAELAGLDPKYYQHVEAGRRPNPEMITLLKLAKGCDVELWKLLNFDIDPSALAEDAAQYGRRAAAKTGTGKAVKRRSGTER